MRIELSANPRVGTRQCRVPTTNLLFVKLFNSRSLSGVCSIGITISKLILVLIRANIHPSLVNGNLTVISVRSKRQDNNLTAKELATNQSLPARKIYVLGQYGI